ncbi:MAG: pyridoxal phosphate-dependent aminotransferase [Bacteroidetes bacterium]|uniref:pyridoxal phosphate-dependent aminotransferase n=1 Tax=unclassified Phnomibacter TaxID=2836226 RepID=UPI002FDD23FF|nr:pyridoxal phosphate-dependent aminotransferase [Bacteroidota bacterium]MCC6762017.1 pyridoxal phosphate-dependent aminotransferase [Chitinophagaceae bacterium]
MKLATRLQKFNEPETLKMAKLARELRAQGHDVVGLSLGEPDFDTPDHIKKALVDAVNNNYSHYPPVAGYPELRQAICTKLKRDNNLDYLPEHTLVSTGAKQSIANLVMATVEEGDDVIVPTPYWVSYSEVVRLAGANPILVRTSLESKFKISPAQLAAAITPKTKLFMFSSPNNPTGTVYSKEELAGLAEVFEKHPDIWIMSDEIYEYTNYVGKHESIAQFASIKDRVIIVNGLSKGYAMTGYRLGYIACSNVDLVKACDKLQGQFTSGANAVTQQGAVAALLGDMQPTAEMVKEFSARRQMVMGLLADIPNIRIDEPAGAFYVFPDVSYYFGKKAGDTVIANADELCMYLLETAHVSTVTGGAFGEPNCIRISYAASREDIQKGFTRIKNALLSLQ